MGRILAIIEIPPVRSKVASLSHSPLLLPRRLGGQSLLEWLIHRVRQAVGVGELAIITDATQFDIARARLVNSVPLYSYGEDDSDSLSRLAEVARRASASSVLRVVAGHPFIDPLLIERLIQAAHRRSVCDYASYFTGSGRRSLLARLGMIAEGVNATALERADRMAVELEDRRDATRFIHSHPELFQVRLLPLAPPFDRRDVRLSLEHHEDWEHAEVIFEALGANGLAWPSIANLVGNNPALRARMERLNRADRV